MDQKELEEVIRNHHEYLYHNGGKRANLSGEDLRGLDLSCEDLRFAIMHNANLRNTNLFCTNLRDTNLEGADMRGANFTGTDLTDANLTHAMIDDDVLNDLFPLCCPERGAFTAFKGLRDNLVAVLEIPEDALRSSAYGRECRASKAKVLELLSVNRDTKECVPADVRSGISYYDEHFVYKVGKTVYADSFDTNRWNGFGTAGIYFYITMREAALNAIAIDMSVEDAQKAVESVRRTLSMSKSKLNIQS